MIPNFSLFCHIRLEPRWTAFSYVQQFITKIEHAKLLLESRKLFFMSVSQLNSNDASVLGTW